MVKSPFMNRITLIFLWLWHSLKYNFFHFLELAEKFVLGWKGPETSTFPETQGTKSGLVFLPSPPLPKESSPPNANPTCPHEEQSPWASFEWKILFLYSGADFNCKIPPHPPAPIQECSPWITWQFHPCVFPSVFLREALQKVSL